MKQLRGKYRHEWKEEINYADVLVLRSRLSAVASADPHAVNGKYLIRSLYFDTPQDKALAEKVNGVGKREKFRIRYYNGDTSFICLEKKSKLISLCCKQSVRITQQQVRRIIDGDIDFLADGQQGLMAELYRKMRCEMLRPKTVVEYLREPYVYKPGNVRVTFDYPVRTAVGVSGFLDSQTTMLPTQDAPILMEVKWDEYMPDVIRYAVQLTGRHVTAYSKYAQCRIYG